MIPTFIVLGVLVVVALAVGFFFMGTYNRLVQLRNGFKNAFAQIDVQLKRRHDLIPNLVETAKGYLKHESGTLEAVIQARNQAVGAREAAAANPGDPGTMKKLAQAESGLGGTLGRLFALNESYPDLKADATMNKLMDELTQTENQVSGSRSSYNNSVLTYNNARETFPQNIIAGMFNFAAAEPFTITDEKEKEAPKVSFS